LIVVRLFYGETCNSSIPLTLVLGDMSDSSKAIRSYSLAVCFTSLFAGAFAFTLAIYNSLEVFAPQAVSISAQRKVESAKQLRETLLSGEIDGSGLSEHQRISIDAYEQIIANQGLNTYHIDRAFKSLIKSSIALIICLLVFTSHWKIANRSEHLADD